MSELDNNEFLNEKRQAIERMRELNRRSAFKDTPHKMPPAPSFVKVNNSYNSHEKANFSQVPQRYNRPKHEKREIHNTVSKENPPLSIFGNGGLPFFKSLKTDGDITLILGLILLLASENSDRSLLLALLYILM